MLAVVVILAVQLQGVVHAFAPQASLMGKVAASRTLLGTTGRYHHRVDTELYARLSDERRKQLGVGDGEDEYDLGMALNNNTDPLISKIIAGSFILVMISLLVLGVVIPSTTDYGEGVCNPLLTGGRC